MRYLPLLFCLLLSAPAKAADTTTALEGDAIVRDFLWLEFQDLSPGQRPKVGLTLSGGAARGFAHVGFLEVLSDAGFPIDGISGTSMGAVIGSLYSAGYPMEQLWELGRRASFSYATKDFNRIGVLKLILQDKLMSSDAMEDFITNRIGDISFEQLKIPFSCVAMDIKTGESVVFREGPLAIAVRSSMNLPGIFKPVQYRHRYLVDGGVADNLPVDAAKKLGMEWILASHTPADITEAGLHNILTYLMQVMEIRGQLLAEQSIKSANMVVTHKVSHIKFTEFHKSFTAGELGLEETYRKLPKIKESLLLDSFDTLSEKYVHQ
ncbi:MAG TPA: patatin-like phospholipase family protein [Elusimicrobiales bacterium]|nr:patatin-like phospholipase family protein [Elusimicrobiales bacterium]